jgi:hypothetical protein
LPKECAHHFFPSSLAFVFCLCHHHSHPNLIEVPASKTLQKRKNEEESAEKNHVDIQCLSPHDLDVVKKKQKKPAMVRFDTQQEESE